MSYVKFPHRGTSSNTGTHDTAQYIEEQNNVLKTLRANRLSSAKTVQLGVVSISDQHFRLGVGHAGVPPLHLGLNGIHAVVGFRGLLGAHACLLGVHACMVIHLRDPSMLRQTLKMLRCSLTSMRCCRSLHTAGGSRSAILHTKTHENSTRAISRKAPSAAVRFCQPRSVMISSLVAPTRCAASVTRDLDLDVDIMVEGNPNVSNGSDCCVTSRISP